MEDPREITGDEMNPEQTLAWLRSVKGELYRTPPAGETQRAWVAVVRTPSFSAERGKLIIAIGSSAIEAARAAASQWRAAWENAPQSH